VFDAISIDLEGRDVVGGRLKRPGGGAVIVLYDTAALAAALAGSQPGAAFDGALVTDGPALHGRVAARVPLLAGLPGLVVAVRVRQGDAITQARRAPLFAAALLAALALTLLVAYLGFRDVAREVNLAAQQASFVASVSHELKTPVASIRLLAETLRMKPSADAAETAPLLDEIREQADRQSRLIDNVLGVARIDRGLPMYRPAEVDVAKAVDQSLERLDYLLRQEGFNVRRADPVHPVRVNADPDGLRQAITNLVTNAVKYSGRCREISITLTCADGMAQLQVADGGIGVEPAEQRKIFDRFYRTAAAARETGGTGLGLALVRHFAEGHGGSVAVESAPGQGSTFTLRLPEIVAACSDARPIP
jgi:signal transduction histidine kinase